MGIRNNQGSSLVEVMVGLFVFAIGLLGILALQSKSMQFNQSAYSYSQAVYLANAMAEQIKANPSPAGGFLYALDAGEDVTAQTDCETNACTPAALADWDRANWLAQIAKSLPAGQGAIEAEANLAGTGRDYAVIRVLFDDSRLDEPNEENEETDEDSGPKEYKLIVGL